MAPSHYLLPLPARCLRAHYSHLEALERHLLLSASLNGVYMTPYCTVSLLRLTNEGSESANRWHKLLEEAFGRHFGFGTTPGQDIFEYFLRDFVLQSPDHQQPLEEFLADASAAANKAKKAKALAARRRQRNEGDDAMDIDEPVLPPHHPGRV